MYNVCPDTLCNICLDIIHPCGSDNIRLPRYVRSTGLLTYEDHKDDFLSYTQSLFTHSAIKRTASITL